MPILRFDRKQVKQKIDISCRLLVSNDRRIFSPTKDEINIENILNYRTSSCIKIEAKKNT